MNGAGLKRAIRRGLGYMAPATWRLRPKNSLVILTYHRVLPKDHPARLIEQPGMYVSPETLAMHLAVLKKHFDLVDLLDWIDRRRTGQTLPDRACAITFDDGWRDNYVHAYPVLCHAGVPATIFLVSDFIGTHYSYWPNRLARLLRMLDHSIRTQLPSQLYEALRRSGFSADIAGECATVEQIDRAIDACKSLPDSTMLDLIEGVEARMPQPAPVPVRELLDLREIEEMRASGLINYGSHTRRHTRLLDGLDSALLDDEVRGSRDVLSRLLNQDVCLFCYPNGDRSQAAIDAVRQTYRGAVTTSTGWNGPKADPLVLRRQPVHEYISVSEASFLSRVSGLL